MCEPVTITLAVIAVAGIAAASYSTYQQAKSAKQQANYQSAVANNNKIIADRAADDSIKRGAVEEQRKRQDIELLKGKQIAGFAGSGTDLSSESVYDVIGETAALGELDALTIRSNYARESYEKRVMGMNYGAQGLLFNYQAQSINPGTSAGLTAITQAGQFSGAAAGASGGGGGGKTPSGSGGTYNGSAVSSAGSSSMASSTTLR
jgi:hypothetical protein